MILLLILSSSFLFGFVLTDDYVHNKETCSEPIAGTRHVHCNWYYLAYAPRVLIAGVDENVVVSTHNISFDVKVTASFLRGKKVIAKSSETVVRPGSLTNVVIKLPHQTSTYSGNLVIEGHGVIESGTNGVKQESTWTFKNSSSVSVKKTGISVFIQTDRPIYKPGETIRIRVLAVTSDLKPVAGDISKVIIDNPSGSRMRQWRDVPLESGFASFKLPLSIKPVLGKWKIIADVKGWKKSLRIEVGKYVLPKFKVIIEPPGYIARGQKQISFSICAKYSYGKGVIGTLTAKYCFTKRYNSYSRTKKPICVEVTREINGCSSFDIDGSEVGLNSGGKLHKWGSWFAIDAHVKETATGITLNATQTHTGISNSAVSLSFDGTSSVFKPGLPFRAVLRATHPDDSPIKKLDVDVHVNVRPSKSRRQFMKKLEIRNGFVKINVPSIPFDAQSIELAAYYIRDAIQKGESIWDRRTSEYKYIKPWYSPSHSYLSIEKPSEILKIGSEASINVHYTSVDDKVIKRKVYYSLMCKGYIAHSGSLEQEFVAAQEKLDTKSDIKPKRKRRQSEREKPTATEPAPEAATTAPPTPIPRQFSSNTFKISFEITKPMSPSCRMIVYYIRGKETVADSAELDIEDAFENKVTMSFDQSEVEPGSKAKLIISASPGSRFAIAAVDKSVHFLRKGNDFRPAQLLNILKEMDIKPGNTGERCEHVWRWNAWGRRTRLGGSDMLDSEKAFKDIGSIILSNLWVDTRLCKETWDGVPKGATESPIAAPRTSEPIVILEDGDEYAPGRKSKDALKIRTEFPETWLWTEEEVDEKTGKKTIEVKVPDTITTWYASGFAVSGTTGLGVANPAEIKAFRPFFISLTLPYSVIRGEVVTVPAAIFNYLSKCLTVRVSLKKSLDYRIVAGPSAKVCLCGGRTATVLFRISPQKLERIRIQVKAEALQENVCKSWQSHESNVSAIDIVQRKLLVEAEGIENEYNYNSLICLKDKEGGFDDKIKLTLPPNVVSGSVYSKITTHGDLMGPSLSGIADLLQMPYGCGEQNMLNFAPNIFIMKYLNGTIQLTEDVEEKAQNYMRSGYQRQLNYKHDDGGYSAFGERDPEASMWLTAFVLKSFAQARPFIDIDDKIISDAVKWITVLHQSESGCFPTVGLLHNKLMKGGVSTPVTLTGYVIISLLEAGEGLDAPSVIHALDCIQPHLKNVNDSYSAAILAYTMTKAEKPVELKLMLDKLEKLSIKEDGLMHWEAPRKKTNKNPNRWYSPYYTARSADIEMTSYALLAYIKNDPKNAALVCLPIVRWLAQQRNSFGGWASTQDTVLAMQALAEYAPLAHGDNVDMTISVSNKELQKDFRIAKDNNLVLQRVEVPKVPTVVKVSARGEGCALLQVSMKYNVKTVVEEPAFAIDVTVKPLLSGRKLRNGRCATQTMVVCARWLKEDVSNMAIIAVRMVSGFVPTPASLDRALKDSSLKEQEMEGNTLNLYFNKISPKETCVKFTIKQTNIVQNMKPASVKVYDYYDNDSSATATYEITKEMCKGKKT